MQPLKLRLYVYRGESPCHISVHSIKHDVMMMSWYFHVATAAVRQVAGALCGTGAAAADKDAVELMARRLLSW